MLNKPVIIWGVGRSGTHLLLDLFSLHYDLCFLAAQERWKKGLWGTMHWGESAHQPPTERGIPIEGFVHFWKETGVRLKDGFVAKPGQLSPETISKIREKYKRLKDKLPRDTGGGYRVLDKCPSYLLMTAWIDEVFKEPIYIHCYRDPRSVLNSILRIYRFPTEGKGRGRVDEIGFWANVPPGYRAMSDKSLIKRLTWQIKTLGSIAQNVSGGHRRKVLLCRYEHLLQNPRAQLESMLGQCELDNARYPFELIPDRFDDFSPPWFDKHGNPDIEHGKERCFLDEEIEELWEIEEYAVKKGYQPFHPGKTVS